MACGVAKEARTRGLAAPAFAGCAFVVTTAGWALEAQRHSTAAIKAIQTGRPIAPAKCANEESTAMTKSICVSAPAVWLQLPNSGARSTIPVPPGSPSSPAAVSNWKL